MLVLVLSLHTFVRMPEIAKKKEKKKKKNATPHIFTAVFERTVRKDSIGIRKGGSQSLVFTEY